MKFFERITPGSDREKRLFSGALLFGGAILGADQISKLYFERNYAIGEKSVIIDGFFDLTHVRNLGAAWSMFSGQRFWLLLIAAVVVVLLTRYFRHIAENCAERYFAILMMISGICGNSIDRLWRGEVVDFISLHYQDVYYYPVFNIADIAICVGAMIYIASGFFRKSSKEE